MLAGIVWQFVIGNLYFLFFFLLYILKKAERPVVFHSTVQGVIVTFKDIKQKPNLLHCVYSDSQGSRFASCEGCEWRLLVWQHNRTALHWCAEPGVGLVFGLIATDPFSLLIFLMQSWIALSNSDILVMRMLNVVLKRKWKLWNILSERLKNTFTIRFL